MQLIIVNNREGEREEGGAKVQGEGGDVPEAPASARSTGKYKQEN